MRAKITLVNKFKDDPPIPIMEDLNDAIKYRRETGGANIVVEKERDKEILDLVMPYTMPDPEWVVDQLKSMKCAMSHFNICQKEYLRRYKKRVALVKIAYLKEKMMEEFVADFATKRHCVISIKNTVAKTTKYRQLRYELKNALDEYMSPVVRDCPKQAMAEAYFNKIGVLKYNTPFSREYYLRTGVEPYKFF